MPTVILWFRQDLRLDDNAALAHAAAHAGRLLPVFLWSPDEEAPWAPGGAARVWLHHSLQSLMTAFERKGQQLVLRRGPAAAALLDLATASGADTILWNECWEPVPRERDQALRQELTAAGLRVQTFKSGLRFNPETVRNRQNRPFQVFTPFWKHCLTAVPAADPIDEPHRLPPPPEGVTGDSLEALHLLPQVVWEHDIIKAWKPGESGAHRLLRTFLDGPMADYTEGRDLPGVAATSRLSPHLHHGEITPNRIWQMIQSNTRIQRNAGLAVQADAFLRQLCWREFAYHLLHHFPQTPLHPLRSAFEAFPWGENPAQLAAWQRGRTGYPIVDAGMRELWTTGWMHNRVRMIVASFLTKDLLIPWQTGARWFWDTLVDADLANNTLGWQWVAGCGADAAPYFRIFNPVMQGQRYDPDGTYIRHWVPELHHLAKRWIHLPWKAPAGVLAEAGITLGRDYPHPIVDHDAARTRALRAYGRIRTAPLSPPTGESDDA